MMTWGSGKSVGGALGEMKDWAAEHDYDAIVGIQLESVVDISSNIAGIVESTIFWVAYGTAIAFRPTHSSPSEPGASHTDSGPGAQQADVGLPETRAIGFARALAHMGTLMPRLTSQTFAGQDVAYPMIMPICMSSQ